MAGVDWGEPVRLPGSDRRAGAAHAVSFDGRIVVAATLLTGEGRAIGIWSSADGIDWTLDLPDELKASSAWGLVVGPEGLVLAGATGQPPVFAPGVPSGHPAIWTSRDARSWTPIDGFAELEGGGISDIAGDASGLVAVGYEAGAPPDGSCPRVAAWRSRDGTAWEALESPAACASVHGLAGRGGRFVVLGEVPDPSAPPGSVSVRMPAAWVLEGDAAWKRLEAFPPPGARYNIVDGPDGFAAVYTGPTGIDPDAPPALTSSDGRTWTPIDVGPFEPDAPNHGPLSLLGHADGFFVGWATADEQGRLEAHLAHSIDGRAWTSMPTSPALNRLPPLSSVLLHDGSVIAFGGRLQILAWASPPAAGGPEPAALLEPDVTAMVMPGFGAPRTVVSADGAALAVGQETDFMTASVEGRVWRWDPAAGWESVAATGLEGAQLAGLARGSNGWVAVGGISRRRDGDPSQGLEYLPHAWASSDGRVWAGTALETDRIGISLERLTGIVHGSGGFVALGTATGANPACPDAAPGVKTAVLTSADGVAWRASDDADIACAQVNGIATDGQRFVAVGAESRLVVVPGPSPSDCGLDVCLGGTAYAESHPLAWTSSDGRDWTRSDDLGLGWGSTGLLSVAAGPGGFVAAPASDHILVSVDGARWTPAYFPITQSVQTIDRVLGGADGYLAIGTLRSRQQDRYTPFFSADGQTWLEVAPTAWSFEPGVIPVTATSAPGRGGGFLVAGGQPGQPATGISWLIELP